jgi:uncharacterized damage-inducible protein DinB
MTEEELTRTIVSSFPSIRDTLAHIVMAEWIWLRRWKGESPSAPPQWTENAPSLDTIVDNLRAVEAERRELLDSITDDDLAYELPYRSMKGDPFATRLDHQMAHVANHSTYHRGQLTTMIRQVGAKPPVTDLIHFLRTRNSK